MARWNMSTRWSPRTRPYEPRRLTSAAAAFVMAGSLVVFLDACSRQQSNNAYCVDHHGNVIAPRYCDSDGYYGGYPTYLWMSSGHYSYGYVVPLSSRSGSGYIPNNSTARAKAGLPSTGRVAGTKVSGGIGHGDSSGSHGDSSGHGG